MARRKHDAYYSPASFARALFRAVPEMDLREGVRVVEPCAGGGALVDPLRRRGCEVITGDIDGRLKWDHQWDFANGAIPILSRIGAVVTNPPYNVAEGVVRRALLIAPRVAMLLRLTWLEPCRSRRDLLERLTFVCPLHPRPSFTDDRRTDSATVAWFVWISALRGEETGVRWILDWDRASVGEDEVEVEEERRRPWR